MQIAQPTFYDFCSQFQNAVKDGWLLSEETDKIPQVIANQFFATLVKSTPEQIVQEAVKEVVKPSSKKTKE